MPCWKVYRISGHAEAAGTGCGRHAARAACRHRTGSQFQSGQHFLCQPVARDGRPGSPMPGRRNLLPPPSTGNLLRPRRRGNILRIAWKPARKTPAVRTGTHHFQQRAPDRHPGRHPRFERQDGVAAHSCRQQSRGIEHRAQPGAHRSHCRRKPGQHQSEREQRRDPLEPGNLQPTFPPRGSGRRLCQAARPVRAGISAGQGPQEPDRCARQCHRSRSRACSQYPHIELQRGGQARARSDRTGAGIEIAIRPAAARYHPAQHLSARCRYQPPTLRCAAPALQGDWRRRQCRLDQCRHSRSGQDSHRTVVPGPAVQPGHCAIRRAHPLDGDRAWP